MGRDKLCIIVLRWRIHLEKKMRILPMAWEMRVRRLVRLRMGKKGTMLGANELEEVGGDRMIEDKWF